MASGCADCASVGDHLGVLHLVPAGQAIFQSSQLEDAFGMSREFVGLENFETLFHDPLYLDSLMTTLQFSISVAVLALVSALILSAFAEQIIRGATMYRTFLIYFMRWLRLSQVHYGYFYSIQPSV